MRTFALEQHFPNPTAAAFRKRVALAGRRYGFRVISLRLLRPRQMAPLLIVGTSRHRRAFSHDVPLIMDLLNPYSRGPHRVAQTFEGFLFAAEDAQGPFLEVQNIARGIGQGGEWAAGRCLYPYPTLAANSCPQTG
jgi:hypothetical protein